MHRASSQQLQIWFSERFSRQNLLHSLSRLLFLLRWDKYGAKKCLKSRIPFDFWDDSTSANQGAGKTIEKPFKELPWNQQFSSYIFLEFEWIFVMRAVLTGVYVMKSTLFIKQALVIIFVILSSRRNLFLKSCDYEKARNSLSHANEDMERFQWRHKSLSSVMGDLRGSASKTWRE